MELDRSALEHALLGPTTQGGLFDSKWQLGLACQAGAAYRPRRVEPCGL